MESVSVTIRDASWRTSAWQPCNAPIPKTRIATPCSKSRERSARRRGIGWARVITMHRFACSSFASTVKPRAPMPDPNWRLLVEKKKVSAQPTGAWTLILDSVAGYSRLKLEAEGNWTYSTSLKDHCGPDGDARSAFDVTHYLLPKAPPGCLIGKLD